MPVREHGFRFVQLAPRVLQGAQLHYLANNRARARLHRWLKCQLLRRYLVMAMDQEVLREQVAKAGPAT